MFFVSKKKYDALKNDYEKLMAHCIFQKDAFDRMHNLAKSVVETNGRIIDYWGDCIKERNKFQEELIALKEGVCKQQSESQ